MIRVKDNISSFPTELLKIILSFTDPHDKKNVLLTCKKFYTIGRSIFSPPIQYELPPHPETLPICLNCKSVSGIVRAFVSIRTLEDYGKELYRVVVNIQ
jgi:hypothetical protein